jgi:site-specific DNA-methyltransferase (adenine-specific)
MKKSAFIEWETPQQFFDTINAEFKFSVDVCALPTNAKCGEFFTPEYSGLEKNWLEYGRTKTYWMNPPYDKTVSAWIRKAYETSQQGGTVVCLIQGRSTDTIMWHDYVMKSSELRFIKDRLHFGREGKHTRANISSVLVVFRPYCSGPPKTLSINNKGERL